MRRTKIICTIGPASRSKDILIKLVEHGMNVARINFSHGSYEEHKKVIQLIKEVRKELHKPIGILLDTKGPEIRVGEISQINLKHLDVIRIGKDIPIIPAFIVNEIKIGVNIFFDDGYIHGKVIGKGEGYADVQILNEGVLQRNKGINIPEQVFDLPDLTEKDIADIQFGCKEGIDMIAASFIRSAKQVLAIKDLIEKEGAPHLLVIAKIENREGVKNFEEIVQVSDGIMVARGDLGIEISVTHLPPIQKKMIRECNLRAKPVIIATQMLESMIKNPMPTRAEASDVANAIYDAASAVMLSGETAMGAYPVQAVKMMHEIACEAERDFDNKAFFQKMMEHDLYDVPSGVARAAVNTCYNIKASAIIACSNSGGTIRRICSFRPKAKIIAVTPSYLTYYQTSIMWGTEGYIEKHSDIEKGFDDIACFALKHAWVNYGDLVVVTMGKPYGISFTTNTLFVESIGKVLVRGQKFKISLEPILGEVTILFPGEKKEVSNKIVVTTKVLESQLHLFSKAKGIILQNHPLDKRSEDELAKLYKTHQIPYIVRADAAIGLLKEGLHVRFDATLGLIFKGESPNEKEMLQACIVHSV
ncbi:MAG: pyruvate kinase [Chlamydiae bacterium]|nr:pyruvate kinase [Chlamydiota bacterium]